MKTCEACGAPIDGENKVVCMACEAADDLLFEDNDFGDEPELEDDDDEGYF